MNFAENTEREVDGKQIGESEFFGNLSGEFVQHLIFYDYELRIQPLAVQRRYRHLLRGVRGLLPILVTYYH